MEHENRMISENQKELYNNTSKTYATQMVTKCKKYFNDLLWMSNLKIVDVGGGGGYFANEINQVLLKNNVIPSIDVIDYCKYEQWSEFKDITFIEDSALKALERYDDSSIDVIFLNYILHHLTMNSYKKAKELQRILLKLVFSKIKVGGKVVINELCVENPILGKISTPIVYWMSSSKLPFLTKISRKLGSQSAGVGVCFRPPENWMKLIHSIGFTVIEAPDSAWNWTKKYIIRDKFFEIILTK